MEIETGGSFNSILQIVQKKSPPDLVISNHDENYQCHFNIIAMSSKKVSSLSGPDRPKIIVLKTRYKLHFLQDVINFFYGHPIILDFINYKEILVLANYFDSEYLKNITEQASLFFDFSQSLLSKSKMNDFSQNEIDFFAFYFQVFSNNETFNNFPFEIIQKVLKSDKMTLVNEDYLVHWILHKYGDENSRKKLLPFVVFEKVSSNGFKEIFSSLKNLKEIQDQIKLEFIKDPRKRNLSIDRNPRYFQKADELNQRILNFELSSVFTYTIPSPTKEETQQEPVDTNTENQTFSEETFSIPQNSFQFISESSSENSPHKTFSLDDSSSLENSPISDKKQELFEKEPVSVTKEKVEEKQTNSIFESPENDSDLSDICNDEDLNEESQSKKRTQIESDELSISSTTDSDQEEEMKEKKKRLMRQISNKKDVKSIIYVSSESDT